MTFVWLASFVDAVCKSLPVCATSGSALCWLIPPRSGIAFEGSSTKEVLCRFRSTPGNSSHSPYHCGNIYLLFHCCTEMGRLVGGCGRHVQWATAEDGLINSAPLNEVTAQDCGCDWALDLSAWELNWEEIKSLPCTILHLSVLRVKSSLTGPCYPWFLSSYLQWGPSPFPHASSSSADCSLTSLSMMPEKQHP